MVIEAKGTGVFTDANGSFTLPMEDQPQYLVVAYLGYRTERILWLPPTYTLSVQLTPDTVSIGQVQISSQQPQSHIEAVESGRIQLTTRDVRTLPSLMGQTDLFKSLLLMPGIKAGSEVDAAIYVRGGSYDQNLILLDGAPVYNPSHLLGFFSVFNPYVVDNVTLIKSGIPSEYGNRISSVIDNRSTNRIPERTQVAGNVGLLASGVSVIQPVARGRGMVYAAARRTYINLAIAGLSQINLPGLGSSLRSNYYNFWDVNLGGVLHLGAKHTLLLSAYQGADNFDHKSRKFVFNANMDWGNQIASLRWNHRISSSTYLDHTVYRSTYRYHMGLNLDAYQFALISSIRDIGHRSRITHQAGRHKLRGGIDWVFHHLSPNSSQVSVDTLSLELGTANTFNVAEYSLFASNEFAVSPSLTVYGGVRLNRMVHYGPYRESLFDPNGLPIDTTHFEPWQRVSNFSAPDFSFSFRYTLSPRSSVKGSASYNNQFIHLVNASSISFPSDFWVPSTKHIPPQSGYQLAAGFFHLLRDGDLEFSVEPYFKEIFHQSEFSSSFLESVDSSPLEQNLIFGRGKAWGVELLLRKTQGRLKGWIGYTFSKTIRSFPDIEGGRWYPAKHDRPHDISLVGSYELSPRWSLSAVFVFFNGSAYTPAIGRYFFAGNIINQYGPYNSGRLPDYHRLDLSATRTFTHRGNFKSQLVLSVYNAYNRSNPFFVYPQATGNLQRYQLSVERKEVSVAPILPSVSWSFSF